MYVYYVHNTYLLFICPGRQREFLIGPFKKRNRPALIFQENAIIIRTIF